jgi:hypothetical protein
MINLNSQILTIKQQNTIKNLDIKDNGTSYIVEKTFSYTKSFTGTQLLIKVKDIAPEYMNNIEFQYNIVNTKILSTGEFIYSINNTADIFTICEELSNDENIITAKPIINTSIKMH